MRLRQLAPSRPGRWLLLVLMMALIGCTQPPGYDASLPEALYAAAESAAEGSVIDIGSALGSDWDRAVWFAGEPLEDQVQAAAGIDWSLPGGYSSGMADRSTLLVIRDDQVVRWAFLPWVDEDTQGRNVTVSLDGAWLSLTPSMAGLEVLEKSEGGRIVLGPAPT